MAAGLWKVASLALEGCLAGSLLLTENVDDEVGAGANGNLGWVILGYDKTAPIMEIIPPVYNSMDPNNTALAKFLPTRDAMEQSRIPPPPGATKLSRFSESAETIVQSYGRGILREARCVVTAYERACNGIDVDGDILALSGSTGWKHRSPWFGVQKMEVPI
eukprot:scaffold67636_cov47-Attheya_sp.AAC.1